MGGCLFILAIICFVIGFVQLLSPEPYARPAPAARRTTPVGGFFPSAGASRPAYSFTPAPTPPAEAAQGGEMNKYPQKFGDFQVGQRIFVAHPQRGETMAHILGRAIYSELWQTQRGPQAPWVPTGNSFAGFWLEGGWLLLNWQNRVYLLDESSEVSDAEIAQYFTPFARQFAQSDQTAQVSFAYPPASWTIVDIGKFRVETVEGEVSGRSTPGVTHPIDLGTDLPVQRAVGRFIHASGDGGRALVLEDYEGGGQDIVWTGYQIEESGVRKE
jgi:hypothetical protein